MISPLVTNHIMTVMVDFFKQTHLYIFNSLIIKGSAITCCSEAEPYFNYSVFQFY